MENNKGFRNRKILIGIIAAVLIAAAMIILITVFNKSGRVYDENELTAAVTEIVKPYYDEQVEVSLMGDGSGRYFTDHKIDHANSVAAESVEIGDAINEALDEGGMQIGNVTSDTVVFGKTSHKTLIGAGISHDTGMCGYGYSLVELRDADGKSLRDENGNKLYEKTDDGLYVMKKIDLDDFWTIRSSHSMNSALIMLINRDSYKKAGFTDREIDMMTAECFAHSKSNSGVTNLNSRESWVLCFDRIDSLVSVYNSENNGTKISFDRKPFESDDELLSSLASETLAIRVGDVSRNSRPDAEAQSGEEVHVDRSTINDMGGTVAEEVEDAVVTIGDDNDPVYSEKDKQVHAGEQNITDNQTVTNDEGGLTHIITIDDGCSAPASTQEAVKDHLGEFASAAEGEFVVEMKFNHFDSEANDFFTGSYEEFRTEAEDSYDNVTIVYPWD